jgi:hypothetical protein
MLVSLSRDRLIALTTQDAVSLRNALSRLTQV